MKLKERAAMPLFYYGSHRTTLKDRRKEIGPGLLRAMLRQLGLTPGDLE
jgi:mRNA interferase HicA